MSTIVVTNSIPDADKCEYGETLVCYSSVITVSYASQSGFPAMGVYSYMFNVTSTNCSPGFTIYTE